VRSGIFVLAIVCAPAFGAPISSSVSATAGSTCSHPGSCEVSTSTMAAAAMVSGNFSGVAPLISMRLYVYVAPTQYTPFPIFYGPASASASYSFQVVANSQGMGRIEADLAVLASRGFFGLQLGNTFFDASPWRAGANFSAPVLLNDPITIAFSGSQTIGGSPRDDGTLTTFASVQRIRIYDAAGTLLQPQLLQDELTGIPEPRGMLLTAGGLLLLSGLKHKGKSLR
jgi:hypothetical protein